MMTLSTTLMSYLPGVRRSYTWNCSIASLARPSRCSWPLRSFTKAHTSLPYTQLSVICAESKSAPESAGSGSIVVLPQSSSNLQILLMALELKRYAWNTFLLSTSSRMLSSI